MSLPYTVDDVAAAVLEQAGEMTTMKLQKLVFYSQAEHLVFHGKPLFLNQVEAWAQGPVVRSLHDRHRTQRQVSRWPAGDATKLTTSALDAIDRVVTRYGRLTAEQLSELTHRELPWRRTREGLRDGARSDRAIPRSLIQSFYRRHGGLSATAADDVIASTALEGVMPTIQAQRLADEVLAGELDANDAVARLLGR